MTGGAGQLIVNMTKNRLLLLLLLLLLLYELINHYIGAFQMFMGNVGVLSRLAYCMGARTQLFLFIYFFLGKSLYSCHFGRAFCRIMQSREMERVTTMNQLTDIRNNLQKA